MGMLLIENCDLDSMSNEVLAEGAGKPKSYWIKGPYLEAEVKNGNGRVYGRTTLEREVNRLNETKIKQNRLLGELEHSDQTTIDLNRVSHLIKELHMDGNVGFGKSLVLGTPTGCIAKSLMDAGVKLGVSTRGIGTLKESRVQDDYQLITVDIVSDPSCSSAFVDNIMEKKMVEIVGENNAERAIEEIKEKLDKYTIEDKRLAATRVFQEFLATLDKR